ncbi:MAG: Holliday junction branch migration protein RuvA [Anaerolineales bacterium]|nr:Holliday junction branch migration protein RuvA [Anaerolineales bacterium]
MIASLRGVVLRRELDAVILEVGGIGFRVEVPAMVADAVPAVGQAFFLHTYLSVRQEAVVLYGFGTLEQRELFEILLDVNGVGPRLALAVLSHLSPEILRSAVVNRQPEVLARVPGIGKKTAERMIFHLKDKLLAPVGGAETMLELDTEVLGVLSALGYNMVEAQAALQSTPEDAPEDVEERVRLALRYFNKP